MGQSLGTMQQFQQQPQQTVHALPAQQPRKSEGKPALTSNQSRTSSSHQTSTASTATTSTSTSTSTDKDNDSVPATEDASVDTSGMEDVKPRVPDLFNMINMNSMVQTQTQTQIEQPQQMQLVQQGNQFGLIALNSQNGISLRQQAGNLVQVRYLQTTLVVSISNFSCIL